MVWLSFFRRSFVWLDKVGNSALRGEWPSNSGPRFSDSSRSSSERKIFGSFVWARSLLVVFFLFGAGDGRAWAINQEIRAELTKLLKWAPDKNADFGGDYEIHRASTIRSVAVAGEVKDMYYEVARQSVQRISNKLPQSYIYLSKNIIGHSWIVLSNDLKIMRHSNHGKIIHHLFGRGPRFWKFIDEMVRKHEKCAIFRRDDKLADSQFAIIVHSKVPTKNIKLCIESMLINAMGFTKVGPGEDFFSTRLSERVTKEAVKILYAREGPNTIDASLLMEKVLKSYGFK